MTYDEAYEAADETWEGPTDDDILWYLNETYCDPIERDFL